METNLKQFTDRAIQTEKLTSANERLRSKKQIIGDDIIIEDYVQPESAIDSNNISAFKNIDLSKVSNVAQIDNTVARLGNVTMINNGTVPPGTNIFQANNSAFTAGEMEFGSSAASSKVGLV